MSGAAQERALAQSARRRALSVTPQAGIAGRATLRFQMREILVFGFKRGHLRATLRVGSLPSILLRTGLRTARVRTRVGPS